MVGGAISYFLLLAAEGQDLVLVKPVVLPAPSSPALLPLAGEGSQASTIINKLRGVSSKTTNLRIVFISVLKIHPPVYFYR
jgi:hypothetical protein